MKTLAYLDCPTGIAGDMCIGALVDAGVPLTYLVDTLARLGIQSEFELRSESVLRNQQRATKVHVDLLSLTHEYTHETPQLEPGGDHHSAQVHPHSHGRDLPHSSRRLPEIEALIHQADLPPRAAKWSLKVFRRLAEAEAAVHGIPPEQVHFHEVGATDAIVDVVGTCLGLDWLNVESVTCSPLPTGGGTVRCEHGLLPVPAPAVLNMLVRSQVPVYSNGINRELVTPTGCAIATTLATSFGSPPNFTLQKLGLGAGGKELALPNILRLWIGTVDDAVADVSSSHAHSPADQSQAVQSQVVQSQVVQSQVVQSQVVHSPANQFPTVETIVELQTQIDDCSPQAIGYLFERLFAAGAVDVFSRAVTMKKNRLGTLISVLCSAAVVDRCEALLFQETTTLGIRRTLQTRTVLAREMVQVSTPYGDIPIKVARSQNQVINLQPEYEDCAHIARARSIPWKQVHQVALTAAIAWAQTHENAP